MNRIRGHVVYPQKPKVEISEIERMVLNRVPRIDILDRFNWTPVQCKHNCINAKNRLKEKGLWK